MSEPAEFDAFISYSHADGRVAAALHRGLHRLARPWRQMRALNVCRDEANLAASPDLWSTIEKELDQSRFLIVVASPDAAGSPWVEREVAFWFERHEASTVLIAMAAGELVWDGALGDFDREASTALPASLYGRFGDEPAWVDLRWVRRWWHRSVLQTRFRDAVASLAAPLHDRSKAELLGVDHRQRRWRVRAVRIAAAVILLLINFAFQQRQTAERDRAAAEWNERIATGRLSDRLAAAAENAVADGYDPEEALLLAVAGTKTRETTTTRSALFRVLEAHPELSKVLVGHAPEKSNSPPVSGVSALLYDPDTGDLLSSGIGDGKIIRWDPATGRRTVLGQPHRLHAGGLITGLALSPDGRQLVSSGPGELVGDGEVVDTDAGIWDLRTGALVDTLPNRYVEAMAFRPDGALVTLDFAPDGTHPLRATVWDGDPRLPVSSLRLPFDWASRTPGGLAFSADGRRLAVAGCDRPGDCTSSFVQVIDVATGQVTGQRLPLPGEEVRAVALSDDGARVAAGTEAGNVAHWDVASGKRGAYFGAHPVAVTELRFAPGGHELATGHGDGTSVVWNVDRHRRTSERFNVNRAAVESLAFSPDGKQLAVGDNLNVITLWSLDGRTQLRSSMPPDHDLGPRSVAASPDGLVAVGGILGWVGVYDTGSGDLSQQLEVASDCKDRDDPEEPYRPCYLETIGFSPDGAELIASSDIGNVVAWDTGTWERQDDPLGADVPCRSLVCADGSGAYKVVLSPDVRQLAAAGDGGRIRVWDLRRRRVTQTIDRGGGKVTSMAFDAEGARLAVGDEQGEIEVWDVDDGRRVGAPLTGHTDRVTAVAFHPTAAQLASTSPDNTLRVWDLDTGEETLSLTNEAPPSQPGTLAFSPDGEYLATVSRSRLVTYWETESYQAFPYLPEADKTSTVSVGFSPDGSRLVTASDVLAKNEDSLPETHVTVTDHRVATWKERACGILRHNLGADLVEAYSGIDNVVCADLPADASMVRETLAFAQSQLDGGDRDEAAAAFGRAASWATWNDNDDVDIGTLVCVQGLVAGSAYAEEVLPACEHAAELAPDAPELRSYLGVARALTGDEDGAIDDLAAFVDSAAESGLSLPEVVTRHRKWIDQLDAGDDPFDRSTLDTVWDEYVAGQGGDLSVLCPTRNGSAVEWFPHETSC